MKRSISSLALVAAIVAILATSCATKPKVPPQEPAQPEPTVQPAPQPAASVSQEELDALLAKAQGLKKQAFDRGLADVLPDDYAAANAALAGGKEAYDAKDGPAAKDKLTTAVKLFTDLNEKGLVELASIRKKNADDMRKSAIAAGAESAAADRLAPGDEALAAAAASDAKDYEAAIASYERARALYELAYKRSVAKGLRERIEDSDYAAWDQGNYAKAEERYAAEEALFASLGDQGQAASPATDPKPLSQGIDALDEAVLRYNLVIQKGREGGATARKDKADAIKLQSEEIKAQVAVKAEYDAALALYKEAQYAMAAGEYEDAAAKFDEAAAAFEKVYALAADKRAKAEAAMKAAEEAAAESLRKAQDADSAMGDTTK
jgi:hypothetical protein